MTSVEERPFVSVVIPVRNGADFLPDCFRALGEQDYGPGDRAGNFRRTGWTLTTIDGDGPSGLPGTLRGRFVSGILRAGGSCGILRVLALVQTVVLARLLSPAISGTYARVGITTGTIGMFTSRGIFRWLDFRWFREAAGLLRQGWRAA